MYINIGITNLTRPGVSMYLFKKNSLRSLDVNYISISLISPGGLGTIIAAGVSIYRGTHVIIWLITVRPIDCWSTCSI